MIADKQTYLFHLTESLRRQWPDYRPHCFVCHGHSVVTGAYAKTVVRPFDAYPHLWHRLLYEKFPTALLNVIVTAIGGERATGGAERFERDVLRHGPDLVTIDYGLNDRGDGLEKARDAWRRMLDKCAAAGVPVILLTPTMDAQAALDPKEGEVLASHAGQIRSLAWEYGVGLCDPYRKFEKYLLNGGDINELLAWPNHPNRLGHEMIARELSGWFPMRGSLSEASSGNKKAQDSEES